MGKPDIMDVTAAFERYATKVVREQVGKALDEAMHGIIKGKLRQMAKQAYKDYSKQNAQQIFRKYYEHEIDSMRVKMFTDATISQIDRYMTMIIKQTGFKLHDLNKGV